MTERGIIAAICAGVVVFGVWLLLARTVFGYEPPAPLPYIYPRGNCREMQYLLSNRRLTTNQWEAVVVPVCGETK